MMDVIEPMGYGEAFNGFCDMKCGVIRIADMSVVKIEIGYLDDKTPSCLKVKGEKNKPSIVRD